jgi:hypothetical protein
MDFLNGTKNLSLSITNPNYMKMDSIQLHIMQNYSELKKSMLIDVVTLTLKKTIW